MTLPSRNDIRHEPAVRLGLFVFLVAAILFPALSVAESPVGPVPAGFNATKQSDGVWRFDRQADNSTPAFWQQLLNLFNLRPATRPAFGRSVAFLTGVAKYDNLRPQLPYVDSDLTELRNFLLTQGGFDTVYEARDDVVRRSLIEDYLVNKFSSESNLLGKDDRLLFYYSGHGADRNGRIGFLEFKQSQAGIFSGDEVLEVDEFARWSRIIVAKHLLVILDSCASGLAASSKVGESSEDRRQMEINSLSGEGSGYLITAGTEAQKAYQLSLGNQRGYSVLTHALLTAMRQGQNDDAFMTINEVFGKAEKSIASFNADQGKRMTPRIFSISRESGEAAGTFVFVNISAKNPPPPPASTGIIVAKGGGTGIVPELVAKDRIIAEEREQIEVQKGSIAGLQKEVDDLRDSSKDTRSAEQIQSLHDLIAAQNMKIKDLQDPLLQREMQNQLKSISNELDLVCESFAECMSRGQRAYHSNDFSAALGFFRQSAIINPELPLAWHWVGHASMAAGRTEEAFAAWDRILALHGAIPLTACEEVGQPMCEGGTLTIMAETLARINMALRFVLQVKEQENFGQVQSILIEAHMDDEALALLRTRFRGARCDERPCFLPHCVLSVLRLVILHCDPEPRPRDEDDAFVRYTIGRACLMMNNLLLTPEEERALLTGSKDDRRIELMVQTMSSFELTNSPRSDHLMPRLQIMYRILLRDPTVRARIAQRCEGFDFESEFRALLGVSLETWLFVIFAIYSYYLNAANALAPNPEYILIDPATFCGESGITGEVLTNVLNTLSGTVAELRNEIRNETMTDSRYDFVSLRSRPILRIEHGKYLPADLSFILEKCHTGVQWSMHDRLPIKRRQTVFNAWGALFEEYVHWLLEGMKTGLPIRYFRSPKWKNSSDESFDGLILKGPVLVPAEYKGGFLPRDARYSGDSRTFVSALNKKFSVGCEQLADKIGRLFTADFKTRRELNDISLDQIRSILPVLVLQDHIFRVPFLNWHLNNHFQERLRRVPLREGVVVRPLTVLHIHELESIVHSVEAEDFDFIDALEQRTVSDPEVLSDLLDALSMFDDFGRKPSPRLKRVLDHVQDDLTSYLFPHHS